MAKTYLLPAEVREAVLAYLGNRPYREVATGIQALMALKPFEDEAPSPPVVEDEAPSPPVVEDEASDG